MEQAQRLLDRARHLRQVLLRRVLRPLPSGPRCLDAVPCRSGGRSGRVRGGVLHGASGGQKRRKESVGEEASHRTGSPSTVLAEPNRYDGDDMGLLVQSSLNCFSFDLGPRRLGSCVIQPAADFRTTIGSQSGLAKFGPMLNLGLRRPTSKKANFILIDVSLHYIITYLIEKVHLFH